MRRSRTSFSSLWISLLTVGVLICLWFLLTPTFISRRVFPEPVWIKEAIDSLGFNLLIHSAVTFARVVLGWAIGVYLGVRVGLWMTRNEIVYAIVNPIVEAIRPIPPIALVPFFIIWFGIGWIGQIILIALGCFMVMTVNTFVAVNNLSPIYIRAATALGASRSRIYKTIIRPAILPDLISGFRIAAALAFGLGIAAEFIGAQSGLGFMIMVARRTLNTNTILLGIVIIGIESFLLDQFIKLINRYRCRWSESSKDSIQRIRTIV
jgi:ABC-type nitrate/sulfonate/bicarbonate transport system permease component